MSETPSAYSVEEHMFRQDEIHQRHPQQPPDQQRSEAEWKELDEQAMTSEQFDKLAPTLRAAHIEAERQQRSDAVTKHIRRLKLMCAYYDGSGPADAVFDSVARDAISAAITALESDQAAAIAERDATIAELRAEVASVRTDWETERISGDAMMKQITALQARVAAIEKLLRDILLLRD